MSMYIKEDNPDQNNIKADNSLCRIGVSFVIWFTVLVYSMAFYVTCGQTKYVYLLRWS